MRKLLTFTLLSIMASTSHASYTYHLALQSTNSTTGALPDGSIRFVKAGDGTGLPPTEIITPPPIVDGGSGEVEYSEEQSCLDEGNANSAKAQVEQFPSVVFGGLFYNASSEKACIAHALLPMKTYSSACKASNVNKLNGIISNMEYTMFGFTYEFTGSC
ncbi:MULTISPECIES: hypothetical protein [Pseudomonas]|uniref:hypothetical protein n=1 Tax=Pseudomonas TaxID=286 RepID=UPI0012D3F871|nr:MULTISPECIES: hypothetical protein [Pseudomonas]MBK3506734.1 hypothetical protein [Pseudomonas sp. MF6747]